MSESKRFIRLIVALWAMSLAAPSALAQGRPAFLRPGDYIVAIVNQEAVTAGEVQRRVGQVRAEASRSGTRLPGDEELRQQVLQALIEDRVLITYARDSGQKVDDAEIDRAVANVAQQNQITVAQLRDRLSREGLDFARFRTNLREQILVERVREREVQARTRITDAEVDAYLEKQRTGAVVELDLAQILVSVPEGASDAVIAERRARIDKALARVRAGEAFDAVARQVSEDGNKDNGGDIGLRPESRLPDLFVERARGLKVGEVSPEPFRSGAGFHVLKLVERRDGETMAVTQTHARHILLRLSPQVTQDAALRRMTEFKQQIETGQRTFEALAREHSEDGSAAAGGDLGWVPAGNFVPEFEEAMNALKPGGLSDPVVSRFGVHLIQVVERRSVTLDANQMRDQARNVLREQKFEEAYNDWVRDLRARAYVEMREPPQLQ